MARGRVCIRQLINEAELDVDTAILMLLDANLQFESADQIVPKCLLARVRAVLDLPRRPQKRQIEVTRLVQRTGKSEREVRDLLYKSGLLQKHRLKYLPRNSLTEAEQLLGLRDLPKLLSIPGSHRKTRRVKPIRSSWRRIGPTQDLIQLTASDVYQLHCVLVEDFLKSKDPIEPPGMRDEGLLDSAVHRPMTSLGLTDKYPTVAMAGAALVHSLVLDHAFHNGNKRTAIVSLLAFLDRNGWVLTAREDNIYDVLLELAQHKIVDDTIGDETFADKEALYLAEWLQSRIRRVALREHPLQFRHLRKILEHYDCGLEFRPGGRIHISCGALHTQISYKTEGADVEKRTIHKIRRDLQFDDEHGYDSDIFYNFGPRIPEFINKYRRLLDRLAKV